MCHVAGENNVTSPCEQTEEHSACLRAILLEPGHLDPHLTGFVTWASCSTSLTLHPLYRKMGTIKPPTDLRLLLGKAEMKLVRGWVERSAQSKCPINARPDVALCNSPGFCLFPPLHCELWGLDLGHNNLRVLSWMSHLLALWPCVRLLKNVLNSSKLQFPNLQIKTKYLEHIS